MTETIRFARIGKQDLRIGTGQFEVELADGRVIILDEVPLNIIESSTLAGLPATSTTRRLRWVTDDVRGIAVDLGDQWLLHNKVYGIPVELFGADPLGKTDSTTAFNDAVSALPANGGTLIGQAGATYLLKNWTPSKNHVRFVGGGFSSSRSTSPTLLRPPNDVLATDDVIRISSGIFGFVMEYVAVDNASPSSGAANAAVAGAGDAYKLHHVLLYGGTTYALDTVVAGTSMDSADTGGIFDSFIYGKVRIKGSNFRLQRNYMNGSGAGTAIIVEGVAAGTSSTETVISENTIESYGTPVIQLNTAGLAGIQSVAIKNNRIQSSAGTGALIDGTNGSIAGLEITGNRIRSTGGTPTRAIDLNNIQAATITGNNIRFTTEWSAGTQAPINVTTIGGALEIDHNGGDGGDIEYDGYRSHSLQVSGTGAIRSVRRNGLLVTTTDATATSILQLTTATSETGLLKARVMGKYGTGVTTTVEGYEIEASFRNRGSVALVGAVTALHTGEDDAGADATIDTTAALVRVRVTGIAATTINWLANVEYILR